ncbi:MAG: hypothetical protein ACOH1E_04035 [Brevundimonas sp.]
MGLAGSPDPYRAQLQAAPPPGFPPADGHTLERPVTQRMVCLIGGAAERDHREGGRL